MKLLLRPGDKVVLELPGGYKAWLTCKLDDTGQHSVLSLYRTYDQRLRIVDEAQCTVDWLYAAGVEIPITANRERETCAST